MHIEILFERNVCENIGFKAMKQHIIMQLTGNVRISTYRIRNQDVGIDL